jgi:hypothetical protein
MTWTNKFWRCRMCGTTTYQKDLRGGSCRECPTAMDGRWVFVPSGYLVINDV